MTVLAIREKNNVLTGAAWMLVTGLMFVGVTGIVRYLGSSLPAVEAAFLRYLIGLVIISPVLVKINWRAISRRSYILFSARGLVHGGAVMLWFFAMARIPIAEVTAIGYVAPIFTTLGAALFLGEKLRLRRALAVVAGFAGTMIILRPGLAAIQPGALAQLAAAPLFAASFLLAKQLTGSEKPAVIVAALSVGCTLVLLPGAIWQWRTPDASEMFWLSLTALFATLGHYTLTRAFASAPIMVTQPVFYLQLVWATILGAVMFDEPADPFVIAGALIVVAAALYITHREARHGEVMQKRPGPH